MPSNVGFRPWRNVQFKGPAGRTESGTRNLDGAIRLEHRNDMGKPPLSPTNTHVFSKLASGSICEISLSTQALSERDACDRAFSNKSVNRKDAIYPAERESLQGLSRKTSSFGEETDLQVSLTLPMSAAAKMNADHKHSIQETNPFKEQQVSIKVISSLEEKEVQNSSSVGVPEDTPPNRYPGTKGQSWAADFLLAEKASLQWNKRSFATPVTNMETLEGEPEKNFDSLPFDMATLDLPQSSASYTVPVIPNSLDEIGISGNSKPVWKVSKGEQACNLVTHFYLNLEASTQCLRCGRFIRTAKLDSQGFEESASSPSSKLINFPCEVFVADIQREKDQEKSVAVYKKGCGEEVKYHKRSYGVYNVLDQEANDTPWALLDQADGNYNVQGRLEDQSIGSQNLGIPTCMGNSSGPDRGFTYNCNTIQSNVNACVDSNFTENSHCKDGGKGTIQAGNAQVSLPSLTSMQIGTLGSSQPYGMHLRKFLEVRNDNWHDDHEAILLKSDRSTKTGVNFLREDDQIDRQEFANDQHNQESMSTSASIPLNFISSKYSEGATSLDNVGPSSLGKRAHKVFEEFTISRSIDIIGKRSAENSTNFSFKQKLWLERWLPSNGKFNLVALNEDADCCLHEISQPENKKHLKRTFPDSRKVQASAAAMAIVGIAEMQSRSTLLQKYRSLQLQPAYVDVKMI